MEALRPPIRDDDHMVILLPTLRGSAPADGVSAPKPGDTHQGAACSRLHGKAAERADTPRIAPLANVSKRSGRSIFVAPADMSAESP
ncbi:MAG: hypothetical protein ABS35_16875 [Kaistia sp. SCN 65-12]|jgi:hypothetical protein|nr:MAG: hypothetical protein ABS35_16875 [Kaistia sp. SCN 65-12]